MGRKLAEPFFSATAVFTLGEFASAIGRAPNDRTTDAILRQHQKSGRIKRVSRGVFASVPPHVAGTVWSVDRFLAASKLREDAVIAYHSALELHGVAYTDMSEVQAISRGRPGVLRAASVTCRFVKGAFPEIDAITEFDRMGLKVRATSLERTLVDVVHRFDLVGGWGEILESLDMVVRVDVKSLVRHVEAHGRTVVAGVLGWWLEKNHERLIVSNKILKHLRSMAPQSPRYALGAARGEGKIAKGWNVILPKEAVDAGFEDF